MSRVCSIMTFQPSMYLLRTRTFSCKITITTLKKFSINLVVSLNIQSIFNNILYHHSIPHCLNPGSRQGADIVFNLVSCHLLQNGLLAPRLFFCLSVALKVLRSPYQPYMPCTLMVKFKMTFWFSSIAQLRLTLCD